MKKLYLLFIACVLHTCNYIQTQENISSQTPAGDQQSISINSTYEQTILSVSHEISIAYLSEKWHLSNVHPIIYPSVFNNYIARAYSDIYKQDVIVKIGESNDECRALQYFQGDGIVQLLNYDYEYCALLLQYIPFQGTLADFSVLKNNDDAVINAFIDLFKKCTNPFKAYTSMIFKLFKKSLIYYARVNL